MKFNLDIELGNTVISVSDEVDSTREFFQKASFYTRLPTKCGNCDSGSLYFDHRTPQGYDYYSINCAKCEHRLMFGQLKDSGELFQKDWEEPYNGNEGHPQEVAADAGEGRSRLGSSRPVVEEVVEEENAEEPPFETEEAPRQKVAAKPKTVVKTTAKTTAAKPKTTSAAALLNKYRKKG